jgi:hypothetical protein
LAFSRSVHNVDSSLEWSMILFSLISKCYNYICL